MVELFFLLTPPPPPPLPAILYDITSYCTLKEKAPVFIAAENFCVKYTHEIDVREISTLTGKDHIKNIKAEKFKQNPIIFCS